MIRAKCHLSLSLLADAKADLREVERLDNKKEFHEDIESLREKIRKFQDNEGQFAIENPETANEMKVETSTRLLEDNETQYASETQKTETTLDGSEKIDNKDSINKQDGSSEDEDCTSFEKHCGIFILFIGR
jgi:hypothetical protein